MKHDYIIKHDCTTYSFNHFFFLFLFILARYIIYELFPIYIHRKKFISKYCLLIGILPRGIGNLEGLIVFAVEGNQIEGSIDFNIFKNMSSLQTLLLWRNRFTGNLSREFGNLTMLTSLELAENRLTGKHVYSIL